MIHFRSITVKHQGKVVLNNLSYHIKHGEKLTISGQSGSGKTTLLNTIAGIAVPETGSITINGTEISPRTITQVRKQIGYAPQFTGIGAENFSQLSQYLCLSVKEQQEATHIGQRIGLDSQLFTSAFSGMSGGEQQRILLSAVLCRNKTIYLLDEPSSALDQRTTDLVFSYIHSLPQTIITVSHNQHWIEQSTNLLSL